MKTLALFILLPISVSGGLPTDALAEEYMKRGATVQDYEQALDRVLERKRGVVTGRERRSKQSAARRTAPSSAASAPRSASAPRKAAAQDVYSPPAVDTDESDGVSIYFGFDSFRLTGDAAASLNKMGQALASPKYSEIMWLIEGHSDAMGSPDYNQTLSERRARSAYRYLVEECGMVPKQLIFVGKGESEPYDRDDPNASVNRRVRIRPVGG